MKGDTRAFLHMVFIFVVFMPLCMLPILWVEDFREWAVPQLSLLIELLLGAPND